MNVWTKLGGGSNIILDEGHVVGIASTLVSLTDNSTNNSQPAWQPVSFGAQTPEDSVAGAIIAPTSLRANRVEPARRARLGPSRAHVGRGKCCSVV
jgi:hypothetical protein